MDFLKVIIGVILPYLAIVVFVGGMGYRIHVWRKMPSPPMTLFPAPADEKANRLNTVKEVLLFRSLFRGDRVLWVRAWLFHAVLALNVLGHLRVFTNADGLLLRLGLSEAQIQAMSGGVGGIAGIVILATAATLLLRRLVVPRVQEITGLADVLALLLIGAIIVTGNIMRFSAEHFDLSLTREYFGGLLTFRNVADAVVLDNGMFMVHMCLALLLLMFIPFSKILHFGGVFFTHQMIRKH